MSRPIAISLSPNTEKDDVVLAFKVLLSPWCWFRISEVEKLEKNFAKRFGKQYKALAINSGRSAWYLILKTLGVSKGDEVIVQAFTCTAVPNSILWLGARPIYLDINYSYNLDAFQIREKISEKTKVVLVQHTFGIPAELDKIKKILFGKKIWLVEDCAHSLGGSVNNKSVGTLGDISFFSFGRDKVLSSVFGGMILCKDNKIYKRLKTLRDSLENPSYFWVIQQLLHPILFSIILPTYNLGLGRVKLGRMLLFIFQKFKFLSFPVSQEEKEAKKSNDFPKKMPAALAILARNQLRKLKKYNLQRKKIANFYFQTLKASRVELPPRINGSIWLRFPIRHKKAEELFDFAKKANVLLGKWYKGIVQPVKSLESISYKLGSCPNAEEFSKNVINLPTYPTMSLDDAKKVVNIIKEWENSE